MNENWICEIYNGNRKEQFLNLSMLDDKLDGYNI